MIRKLTTLILGAGASKDYGFPLGKELVDQIIRKLENPDSNGTYKILADLGHSDSAELGEFVTNLKGSNLDSIDEFLLKQPKYSELAKKSIAIVLIPYEKEEYLRRNGWYRFLVNRLFEGITKDQFHHSQLAIITFNYDRSVECYLKNSFRYTFGVNDSEAERYLGVINIVHVYGQLGRLSGDGNDSRVYDPSLVPEFVRRAAGQIVTVQELLGNKNKINEIAGILKQKENRVYFFGFGFSDLNLDIIRSYDYVFIFYWAGMESFIDKSAPYDSPVSKNVFYWLSEGRMWATIIIILVLLIIFNVYLSKKQRKIGQEEGQTS